MATPGALRWGGCAKQWRTRCRRACASTTLLPALLQVSEELVRQRPPEYVEVPSRETLPPRAGAAEHLMAGERTRRLPSACHWSTWRIWRRRRSCRPGTARSSIRWRRGTALGSDLELRPRAHRTARARWRTGVERCFEVSGHLRRLRPPQTAPDHLPTPPAHALGVRARGGGVRSATALPTGDVGRGRTTQLAVVWLSPHGGRCLRMRRNRVTSSAPSTSCLRAGERRQVSESGGTAAGASPPPSAQEVLIARRALVWASPSRA